MKLCLSKLQTNILMKIFLLSILLFYSIVSFSKDKTETFNIAQYHGKIVYLDFWASWCIPCRKSFPWMNAMQKKYEKNGLEIIAINLDENKEDAELFLKKYKALFTIKFDNGDLATQYEVKGMPYTIIYNREGKLIDTHIGFKIKQTKEYEQIIKNLLNIQ